MPKLETSRVHDAYEADSECPFCWLLERAERTYLESFRGHRVMTPESRVRTNEDGFCPTHFQRLYGDRDGNPLGLALITRTHLERWIPELQGALQRAAAEPARGRQGADLGSTLLGLRDRCCICDLLAADLDRYCFTVSYLWKRDPEFRPRLSASRGFCLPHLAALVAAARRELAPAERPRFLGEVLSKAAATLDRLDEELAGFIELFQATSPGPGTESQRTALARSIQVLSGRIPRKE